MSLSLEQPPSQRHGQDTCHALVMTVTGSLLPSHMVKNVFMFTFLFFFSFFLFSFFLDFEVLGSYFLFLFPFSQKV